jgi:hypothetical protein
MTAGQPLIKSIFWLFRGNVAYKETHKKHGSLAKLTSKRCIYGDRKAVRQERKTSCGRDRKIDNQNEEIVRDRQVSEGNKG